jgi:uncharacterized phage protein (TIGR02218 family)
MVFLDRPLLDIRPDYDRLEHGQNDDFTLTGIAPGAATPWKSTTKTRRKLKLKFLLDNKTQWKQFRDFFAVAKGGQRGFWVPIWITDYESFEQNQGGAVIKIRDIDLSSVFTADEQYAFLTLIDRTKLEAYEIANITILGGGDEQLNLAGTIAGTFATEETLCCGLMFARIDGALKYKFITDSVVRCDLEFVELPREYVTEHTGATPIYLYEFTRSGLVWRMTNWPEPLVLGSECWSPDNIRHGSIRSGVDFLAEDLQIEAATEDSRHPLRYYLNRNAFEVTELQIFETDLSTLTFDPTKPLYKGRVGNVEFEDEGEIRAMCSSLLRVAEQQLPRMQMQRPCNHRLYDLNCGVSPGLFEITGTLTAVTDEYVEATAFATEATARGDAQWFALGKVTVGSEKRMVVGQSTNKLYIDEPFSSAVAAGQSAVALPGCNKRVSHCVGRFNNIVQSLQFTYMPNSNPQVEAILNPKPQGGKK